MSFMKFSADLSLKFTCIYFLEDILLQVFLVIFENLSTLCFNELEYGRYSSSGDH